MEKIFFEIDAKSKIGKQVIPLLKGLSETNTGIGFLSLDEAEDRILEILMRKAVKSGIAPKERVLAKLGIK